LRATSRPISWELRGAMSLARLWRNQGPSATSSSYSQFPVRLRHAFSGGRLLEIVGGL
jgi:hypothetical protein